MVTKTITVSVKADVEAKFRKIAAATHGKKKGYLGKALTEAMERWTNEREEKDTVGATLRFLDEGIELRGVRYRHRNELHER